MTNRRPSFWLAGILIGHLVLGGLYSVVIPMWEAYDEWGHYAYVRFVAEHFRLPTLNDASPTPNDERRQPPLYYFITGILTAPIQAPSEFLPQPNLLFSEDTSAGFNVAVHPDSERFPYHGTALALHAARLVSVLLSTLGVWATYTLVLAWLPGQSRIALLAAGVHAFWPQFLFNGSVVTNDIFASVSASLFITALYLWWQERPTWRTAAGVLLTGAMLALSKFTVYGLVIGGGLVFGFSIVKYFFYDAARRRKYLWQAGGLLLLILVGGYISWSLGWIDILFNSLMGQWLKYILLFDPWLQNLLSADWRTVGAYLAYGLRTFWASFGWGNLEAPGWTYLAAGLLGLASTAGVFIQWRRSPQSIAKARLIFLSLGACLLLPLLHAVREESVFYFPGRYLLSAISPACALLAAGYAALWPEHLKLRASLGLGIGLAALAAALPFTILQPAYQRPPLLGSEQTVEIQHPLDIRYGNSLQLVGYTVSPFAIPAGDKLALTLYWRCLQPVQENYILTVKALSADFSVLDQRYLFPGRGNFATSLWRPGDFFKETYFLKNPTQTSAPIGGQFLVDFLDDHYQPALGPQNIQSRSKANWFGEFKVLGGSITFQPETLTNYRLNDEVALKGFSLIPDHPQGLKVNLVWEALQTLTNDYTLSLKLIGADGKLWVQDDSPPRAGNYPTHLWTAGEQVEDSQRLIFPLNIPCGDYTLELGLYDLASGFRLPVTDGNGSDIPDRAIKIHLQLNQECVLR